MKQFIHFFILLHLIAVGYATTSQVSLVDPVQEKNIYSHRAVLQFGVFNKSRQSQRMSAKLKTLAPGDHVGFYTNDHVINQQKFDTFLINKSKIRISPRKINVAPKQMRLFRVAVNLKGAEAGTYFGNLLIKQLPLKSKITSAQQGEKNKGLSVQLNILFDQYGAFYLNKGKGNPFDPPKDQMPVKIECTVDKEKKNLTMHIYNNTSYALRTEAISESISDQAYNIITVLPYTEGTREIAVPITQKSKLPLQLSFLIKNQRVSSVMCQ